MLKLILNVIDRYNIPVTHDTVKKDLLSHPLYPTLSSISDAFEKWRIRHTIAKLSFNHLNNANVPVISALSINNIILIENVNDEYILFRDSNFSKKKYKREQFEKSWSGISIIIDDISCACEKDYKIKKREEIIKKIFISLLLVVLFTLTILSIYIVWTRDNLLTVTSRSIFLINNSIGVLLCLLLYRRDKLKKSGFLDSLCKIGSYIDCDKVTNSFKGRFVFFDYIVEIAAAYFSTISIWIIFAPLNSGQLLSLYLFFLLSVPVFICSLLIQLFYVRKICILCCAISLLMLNIIFIKFPIILSLSFDMPNITMITMLFISVTIIFITISKLYENKCKIYQLVRKNANIKFDIRTLYAHMPQMVFKTPTCGFCWGDKGAKYEISVVVSIGCKHCEAIIQDLLWLIDTYPNICYKLIFYIKENEYDAYTFINYLYYLYKQSNLADFLESVKLWYNSSAKAKNNIRTKIQAANIYIYNNFIESQYTFCKTANPEYVPAIYINGHLLSQKYSNNDIQGISQFLSKI